MSHFADSALQRAFAAVNAGQTLDRAIAIQQIPAPTFAEARRAEYVACEFKALGLSDVEVDDLGNVFARRPGRGGRHPVLVTAHTDTVFPADTDLTIQRQSDRIVGPGLGDNSLGVAGLFGLIETLNAAAVETPADVWLAANVGEEGLGDLRGMRRVMERFGPSVAATIIIEGMAFGHIYHEAIGVHRFRITARAEGGHSYTHFGRPSAVHGLVRLASRLADLPLPAQPKTTLNIGQISGGTSVNTIARQASLELDLRSEDPKMLAGLVSQVEKLIQAANAPGLILETVITSQRPAGAIPRSHPLVQLAVKALRAVETEPTFEKGSTDTNVPLSLGLPAVCIGLSRGGNAHRPDEYVEPAMLANGLKQLLFLVLGAFEL
ncbi:MAG: M20/M25/M40 family metallo-hydrolase [Chloroflexi bacterium]|nr:M20/M25/M40 family metallo-hydrolase [Chloroflexota bacterium]